MLRYLLVGWVVALLAACAGPVKEQHPAVSVETRPEMLPQPVAVPAPRTEPEKTVQTQPYRPAEQVAVARPQPARAVVVLMKRAADQRVAGDYAAAAASLERGLRIDPRNPTLWNRLAKVRLQQQQYARAESFAAKSNALAGGDAALQADNWDLIARARAALGDHQGSTDARQRARILQ